VTDHAEYVRGYPASPAGRLEAALLVVTAADLERRRRRRL
jgi:hypothetical protein